MNQYQKIFDDQLINPQQDVQKYNIMNGIDEILYQKVINKLQCSAEQEQESTVPIIIDDDNDFQDMLETYNMNTYDSSNRWIFWIIVALIVLIIYLFYKYQTQNFSTDNIRATILGYTP